MKDKEEKNKHENADLKPTILDEAVSSCIGALITSAILTPFEVVKTIMQAQRNIFIRPSLKIHGVIDGFTKIIKYEGMTRLWSGFNVTLVLLVPSTVAFFVLYDQFRLALRNYYNEKKYQERMNYFLQEQPVWIPVIAASSARVITAWIVSPLEMIKTKLQSSTMTYNDLYKTLQQTVRKEGIRPLWKGVYSTLLRDILFSATYWMCYEQLKISFQQEIPTFYFSFTAGGLSGCFSSVITGPLDVVKTYQQIEIGRGAARKTPGMYAVMKRIYQTSGYRGLFTGIVPRVMRLVPAAGIMISTTETMKFYMINRRALKEKELNLEKEQ